MVTIMIYATTPFLVSIPVIKNGIIKFNLYKKYLMGL
jgi:hypothetical protein